MILIDRAIKQNPQSASLYAHRARLILENRVDRGNGAIDRAAIKKIEQDLKESLVLDDTVSDAYYVRARLSILESDEATALKDLSRAIELCPANLRAHLWRADILEGDGKYGEACKDLDAAVKLVPGGEMHMKRALLKRHAGDLKGAIEDYTIALKGGPASFIYSRRADVYEQARQFEKAIADQRKSLETNDNPSDRVNSRKKIARMLLEMKHYGEAASEFETILRMNPDDFPSIGSHLTCQMKMKNWSAALADVNKLIGWESGYAGYYRQRAEIYRALGKAELAALDEKKAQQLKQ